MTEHPFTATLATRFGGLLRHGSHEPDGLACALEVATIARGGEWSDEPTTAKLPDIRQLNDGLWDSDEQRTEHMAPLILALWNWPRCAVTKARQS